MQNGDLKKFIVLFTFIIFIYRLRRVFSPPSHILIALRLVFFNSMCYNPVLSLLFLILKVSQMLIREKSIKEVLSDIFPLFWGEQLFILAKEDIRD